MTTLTTNDLILRPWRKNNAGEIKALYHLAKDPDIGPSAGWKAHESVEESAQVIEHVLCNAESYAIVLRAFQAQSRGHSSQTLAAERGLDDDFDYADKPIGSISLQPPALPITQYLDKADYHDYDNSMELGFWIGKPFWGRGFAPQASRALMQHGFDDLHLDAIWCRHDVENIKSGRAQDKIGFTHVAILHHVHMALLPGDVYRNEELRYITKEQWQAHMNS